VTAASLLAAVAALLALSAARELAGSLPDRLRRRIDALAASRGTLGDALPGRLTGAAAGALAAWLTMPVAPGRTAVLLALGLPAAGALVPQALIERRARARRRRLVAALPDALDLLAVGSASGRSPAAGFAEVGKSGTGPLAEELRVAAAETACGVPLCDVLAALRERVPGSEVATLCASIERSRVLGSPLADQLRRQATSLRRDQRRAVEESSARAAPKIQLVVALVLVPSVLLMIGAALIANADVLLSGL
jgi:tight adherence protein C